MTNDELCYICEQPIPEFDWLHGVFIVGYLYVCADCFETKEVKTFYESTRHLSSFELNPEEFKQHILKYRIQNLLKE